MIRSIAKRRAVVRPSLEGRRWCPYAASLSAAFYSLPSAAAASDLPAAASSLSIPFEPRFRCLIPLPLLSIPGFI